MLWDFRSSILVNLFWLHQQLGMKALMPYLVSMGLYWHYHGGEGNFPLTSRFWSLFTPIDTPGRGRGGICHFYRWVEEVEFWSPYWVTTCVWGVGFMVFGWRKAVLIKKNVLFLLSKATPFTVLPLERASFSCGWFSVIFSFSFFACAMWYFWVEASLLSSPVYMRQKEIPENSLSFCSANSSVIKQSIFSPPFRILMFAFYILCSGILAILSGRNRKKHVFSFCMELDVLNDLREKVVH